MYAYNKTVRTLMRRILLIFFMLFPVNAMSDDIPAMEMQQIIRKVEADGANNFCNRADLISCLGVTKDQCLSELSVITQFCSSKHLRQLPDLTGNGDIEIGIGAGMQFGQCLLQDYLVYKSVDAGVLKECLSRSNNSPQPTPKSGAAGL